MRAIRAFAAMAAAFALSHVLFAGGQNAAPQGAGQPPGQGPAVKPAAPPKTAGPGAAGDKAFDPHVLTGTWTGDVMSTNLPAANLGRKPRPPRFTNLAMYDLTDPEPPLTPWAKEHLMMKSIAGNALGDRGTDFDPNGIPANDPKGEFPGKDCEPLAAPAIYDDPVKTVYEFIPSRDGNRLFQFVSRQREWRTFFFNQDHPKDVDPSYEGHSTAKWDGNTLVVDTVGFNDKTMISQNVAHWKSETFRLVERFTRTSHDYLELEMTMFDPKAWGEKSWGGYRKYFKLVPDSTFQEAICNPRDLDENGRIRAVGVNR